MRKVGTIQTAKAQRKKTGCNFISLVQRNQHLDQKNNSRSGAYIYEIYKILLIIIIIGVIYY